MDIKKLKESDSPLVGRKVITLKVSYTGESTPSGEDMKTEVAKYLKVNPELVEIDRIMQDFGNATATVYVNVYTNTEALKRFGVQLPEPKKIEAK